MYPFFDAKTGWSLNPGQARQVCYDGMPNIPLLINAPPTVNQASTQPIYYQFQPACYVPVGHNIQLRPRQQSNNAFVPQGGYAYDPAFFNYAINNPETAIYNPGSAIHNPGSAIHNPGSAIHNPGSAIHNPGSAIHNPGSSIHNPSYPKVTLREITNYDSRLSSGSGSESQPSSSSGSPESQPSSSSGSPESIRGNTLQKTVRKPAKSVNIMNSLSLSSNSNTSSSSNSNIHDDSIIHTFFPSSLCAALNGDPPEPPTRNTPLKTSSPISKENECKPLLIDVTNLRKRRGRKIESASSEKCPRFNENGVCEDLDQCDKIIIRSREPNSAEDAAKRREEFLLILEAERERQKKLVLPKHAPKMSCKFCINNGECAEVYTKHRLHSNEKTVCPILRHYVCRLCSSTGDFAHTIRHCPFNNRKDQIAWKATFLS